MVAPLFQEYIDFIAKELAIQLHIWWDASALNRSQTWVKPPDPAGCFRIRSCCVSGGGKNPYS